MNHPSIMTLSALAEPSRLRMIELLRNGARSVNEIAEFLGIRQPQASKHLRVLTQAGLVIVRPHAQRRIYELQAQPFKDLDTWLATFSHVWDRRVDTLDTYLQQVQKEGKHRDSTT